MTTLNSLNSTSIRIESDSPNFCTNLRSLIQNKNLFVQVAYWTNGEKVKTFEAVSIKGFSPSNEDEEYCFILLDSDGINHCLYQSDFYTVIALIPSL